MANRPPIKPRKPSNSYPKPTFEKRSEERSEKKESGNGHTFQKRDNNSSSSEKRDFSKNDRFEKKDFGGSKHGGSPFVEKKPFSGNGRTGGNPFEKRERNTERNSGYERKEFGGGNRFEKKEFGGGDRFEKKEFGGGDRFEKKEFGGNSYQKRDSNTHYEKRDGGNSFEKRDFGGNKGGGNRFEKKDYGSSDRSEKKVFKDYGNGHDKPFQKRDFSTSYEKRDGGRSEGYDKPKAPETQTGFYSDKGSGAEFSFNGRSQPYKPNNYNRNSRNQSQKSENPEIEGQENQTQGFGYQRNEDKPKFLRDNSPRSYKQTQEAKPAFEQKSFKKEESAPKKKFEPKPAFEQKNPDFKGSKKTEFEPRPPKKSTFEHEYLGADTEEDFEIIGGDDDFDFEPAPKKERQFLLKKTDFGRQKSKSEAFIPKTILEDIEAEGFWEKKADEFHVDFIYGRHPVVEGLQQGKQYEKILLLQGTRGEFEKEVRQLCKDANIPLQVVPKEKLESLTSSNHQGIIGIVSPIEYQELEDIYAEVIAKGEVPLFVLLDGITDVRNIGAIARSAEIAGAHALVVSKKNVASINAEAMKTSAGPLNLLPVCRSASLQAAVSFLQSQGVQVLEANMSSKTMIYDAALDRPTALVMGAEGSGVNRSLSEQLDGGFSIPMVGKTDSFNVSVATGIILYEILRQRAISK